MLRCGEKSVFYVANKPWYRKNIRISSMLKDLSGSKNEKNKPNKSELKIRLNFVVLERAYSLS